MNEGSGHDEVPLDYIDVGSVFGVVWNFSFLTHVLWQKHVEKIADQQNDDVDVVNDAGLKQDRLVEVNIFHEHSPQLETPSLHTVVTRKRVYLSLAENLLTQWIVTTLALFYYSYETFLQSIGVEIKIHPFFLQMLHKPCELPFEDMPRHLSTGWLHQHHHLFIVVLKLSVFKSLFFDSCLYAFELIVCGEGGSDDWKVISFSVPFFDLLSCVFYDNWTSFDDTDPIWELFCFVEMVSCENDGAVYFPEGREDVPDMYSAERI